MTGTVPAWTCPDCRLPLEPAGAGLRCPECARVVRLAGDIPVFGQWPGRCCLPAPLVEELAALLGHHDCERAASQLCACRGLARGPASTNWTFFFSPPANGWVLELGAGFGDDTLALAERAQGVVSLVPDEAGAAVLARRLAEQVTPRIRIAVARDAARLPLADGAVAGVVLEHAAMVSMGATRRRWPAVARELRRVLAPGGAVLFTAAGFRLPGLGAGTESLNRALKRRPAEQRARIPGLSDIVGGMAACGFAPPEIYAPLPDVRNTACVVPLGDAGAVGDFLDRMVDIASPLKRAAALAARVLAGTGMLARLAPECWLIWGGAGAPG